MVTGTQYHVTLGKSQNQPPLGPADAGTTADFTKEFAHTLQTRGSSNFFCVLFRAGFAQNGDGEYTIVALFLSYVVC